MDVGIPYDKWLPLSVEEVVSLFKEAPFTWCLAGGYAIEQFLGAWIRPHSDIDITVFRDEQLNMQRWLANWRLYAADPPGTLRPWLDGERLIRGVHDIWGHLNGFKAWQLQIMLTEVDGAEWVSRRSTSIRGKREDLITAYKGIPCIRPEIQLLHKAKNQRPKDDHDFWACLPALSIEAKQWLKQNLRLLYPQGHDWLEFLE